MVRMKGKIDAPGLDIDGWDYRVMLDHDDLPWLTSDRARLCLVWTHGCEPRLAYLSLSMIYSGAGRPTKCPETA